MAPPKKIPIADRPLKPFQMGFNGTWKPGLDATQMKEGDFKILTNMRYTDLGIRSVWGMSKINTTALAV